MIVSLQLRQTATPLGPATAWFLPGDSVERWLEQLTEAHLADADTCLFVVGRKVADLNPVGLLVVPSRPQNLSAVRTGIACRALAGRLFLPVNAVLYPPLTDAEIRSEFPLSVNFFHPSGHISGFEDESALRVWNLIGLPAERNELWNYARVGEAPPPALSRVALLQPPSLENLFGDAADEIAVDPPAELPPSPDEVQDDALSKSKRGLRRLFAKGIAGFLRQWPHTGSRRNWVNDAEEWAQRQMRGVNDDLEKLRNKELYRLLHLLENDPESGLRHAIPMNAFAHRGVAPPSSRLNSRSPNFDLSRLGREATDFWNIPFNLQETLRRRYREMADREMQLGCHRRAAYIYAELLGDLVSAANALKQGRLFREAAVIYDEHLRNPREAARCLADGGLLAEAIERYEKLGDWMEVANLYERMGNTTAAYAAIRKVVDDHLSREDRLSAARLVEERLHAPEEALQILNDAWPASSQAVACLNALFHLHGRLGQHEHALSRLVDLAQEKIPSRLTPPLITVLCEVARTYPEERMRYCSADICRVLAAQQLKRPESSASDAATIVHHLIQLAPDDRLLNRDGSRYLAERKGQELRSRRVIKLPPVLGAKPVVHRRFELPRQIEWIALRREWHWFYALGGTAKRLTLLRGVWEGEVQSLSWESSFSQARNGMIFEPTNEKGKSLALAHPGGPPFELKKFPASDLFFNESCTAGTPSWLSRHNYPVTFGEDSVWSIHVASGRAVLACHDKQGRLQRTSDITIELLEDANRTEATKLCLSSLDSGVAVALGNRFVSTRGDGGFKRLELPAQAVGLCSTLPHTRQGVAVMLEAGAFLHWLGTEELLELDRDIASPMGTFVPGGPVVLVSDKQIVALEVDARGVHNITRMELSGPKPIGLTCTSNPGEFAILQANGEMTIYRIPR